MVQGPWFDDVVRRTPKRVNPEPGTDYRTLNQANLEPGEPWTKRTLDPAPWTLNPS